MDLQLKLTGIMSVLTLISFLSVMAVAGCVPTVQVVPSDEPIEVNLNVKIDHEIRIKVDKEIDDLFSDDDVF